MKAEGTRGVGVGSLSRTLLAQQLQQRTVSLRVLEAGGLGLGAASRVLVRPSRCVCSRRSGSLLSASPHEEAHLRTSANPHHPPPTAPLPDAVTLGHLNLGPQTLSPQQEGYPSGGLFSVHPLGRLTIPTCPPVPNDAHRITRSTGPAGFSSCDVTQVSLSNYKYSPRCFFETKDPSVH